MVAVAVIVTVEVGGSVGVNVAGIAVEVGKVGVTATGGTGGVIA